MTVMADEKNTLMEATWVENLMIPMDVYPYIPQWYTLKQAMKVLESSKLEVEGRQSLPRSLLVFDEEYNMVGYVRRRDIMRGLEPKFLVSEPLSYRKKLFDVKIDPNLSELSFDKVVKGMREQAAREVSEVMRPVEVTIFHDDHLMKAVYEMVSYSVSLIPVIKDQQVIGVIRSADVFHQLSKILLDEELKS